MKRKVLVFGLILVLSLGLIGCSGSENGDDGVVVNEGYRGEYYAFSYPESWVEITDEQGVLLVADSENIPTQFISSPIAQGVTEELVPDDIEEFKNLYEEEDYGEDYNVDDLEIDGYTAYLVSNIELGEEGEDIWKATEAFIFQEVDEEDYEEEHDYVLSIFAYLGIGDEAYSSAMGEAIFTSIELHDVPEDPDGQHQTFYQELDLD